MRTRTPLSTSVFQSLHVRRLPAALVRRIFRLGRPGRRRPPLISAVELIPGLVWHDLQGTGTLAENVGLLTRKKISDGALSQRRTAQPWQILETILEEALIPKAKPTEHPEAFHRGRHLCGTDGSRFSAANTPRVKWKMTKAAKAGEVAVWRISFAKTLHFVRELWQSLEVSDGILSAEQVRKVVRRTMRLIARRAIPKRRQRSCPRELRQTVSSWPRLMKHGYQRGPAQYEIAPATAWISYWHWV